MDTQFIILGLAFLYFVTRIISKITASIHYRKFAKAHGCQPVKLQPDTGPLGLKRFYNLMQAGKRKETVQHGANRHIHGNTLRATLLGIESITTIEPENIKTVLATSFKDFSLGKRRHDNFAPLLGDGIFTLDGAGWEHSRALLRPQFNRDQVSDLDALEIFVQRLLAFVPENENEAIDLQPLIFRLTLDSATEFLFGESADSLLEKDLDAKPKDGEFTFAQAFDGAQDWMAYRARFGSLFWLVNPKDFQRKCAFVHNWVDKYVDHSVHPEKRGERISGRKYVFSDELGKETTDRKVLRDQMLNILVAGRDTTAGLIGWCIYLFARHPEVYQKLRREVINAFGTGIDGKGIKPSYSGLKDVTYLRYILNEVLRLYPSVPFNSRVAVRDTVLPCGGGPDGLAPAMVKKGQSVVYSVYALHRRKDIYGEDALEFRPERWGEGNKIGRGWEYLPFNGGPRICLGQQYALTEAGYTLVRICQGYESIENADPVRDVRINAKLTISPNQCLVRMRKAKPSA